jgi:hypothetical protein
MRRVELFELIRRHAANRGNRSDLSLVGLSYASQRGAIN